MKRKTPVIALSRGRSNVEDTGDRNVERNEGMRSERKRETDCPVPYFVCSYK